MCLFPCCVGFPHTMFLVLHLKRAHATAPYTLANDHAAMAVADDEETDVRGHRGTVLASLLYPAAVSLARPMGRHGWCFGGAVLKFAEVKVDFTFLTQKNHLRE